ncbi:thioredoxin family protein [Polaribacter sp. Z014]|uniref:thioredoxin family protein n=1 Tax=unclassified Polaribacter TaxID=196858 RepID=UPI00193AF1F4|nr:MULTISPECIES: thioredoxin family protein [unclassified Polaribacter]MCL7762389.1 thioredoxin family protein [Polaribacter sp. Z014]QVY64188.1 thioredoxin family protein [Polaribacter sp. Q13]
MTRFGELLNTEKPVLIDFYTDRDNADNAVSNLRDVVAALGNKAKIIKIDIAKNENLADALKVKGNPTFMIYKKGQVKWRQTGFQEVKTLISLVEEYV